MLDREQRIDRYLAQTSRRDLTDRQVRRVEHKAERSTPQAVHRRAIKRMGRAHLAGIRRSRLSGLVSP